tara:strand:- start:3606 stop:5978 length:2373 start_codon:yes stop_codon:yes gene_type:complete
MPAIKSKAQILIDLQPKVTIFKVPDLIVLLAKDINNNPSLSLKKISSHFDRDLLIVRSSAADEDGSMISQAGAYDSVLGVMSDKYSDLLTASKTVIDSYLRNNKQISSNDEIIFQQLIDKPLMSGVIFTHELNTGAPYYVINYDDISGNTDTVTSGGSEYSNRTLYVHRGSTSEIRSERFKVLISAVKELEILLDNKFLDIEFAVDKELQPYLLQVRAITTKPNWNRSVSQRIDSELDGIKVFIRQRLMPQKEVFGSTTIFGQMPDWNPAEMIGRAPRSLSLSLYRMLITDHVWRQARERMGYATPNGQALMISLAGQPFIDTRLSFHSFLPATLPKSISEKLVNSWVDRLRSNPELHDKIEFEVAITTLSFDIDSKLKHLVGDVLTNEEQIIFKNSLKELTLPLIENNHEGSITNALLSIKYLESKKMPTQRNEISSLLPVIHDCCKYGTEPFSILARHGFIAQTILFSLVERGVISDIDLANFQSSIRTITTELVEDMKSLQADQLTKEDFMKRYGHLRPGTYDILSPRYDKIENFTFTKDVVTNETLSLNSFKLKDKQIAEINKLLLAEGFNDTDCAALLDYCSRAIAGREYGKFIFTRSVSAILEIVSNFGILHNLSREEMSHIPINYLLDMANTSSSIPIENQLRQLAEKEAERHLITSAIRLPQVLFDEAGVHVVPFQVSQPNFITTKQITSNVICLDLNENLSPLKNNIILIENADPGYDWIFSQGISGLITKYGGANSHMAIRCAEFGIPAAIGCGEQRFEKLFKANQINLDCSSGLITIVN